jgi:hypothetical protein
MRRSIASVMCNYCYDRDLVIQGLRTTVLMLGVTFVYALLSCRAGVAADVLNFEGGMGTGEVDAYTGAVGGGWSTPWTISSQAVGSPVVTNVNPLTPEGGNYLSVATTGTDRNVIRQYGNTPDFNIASPHTISWQWRLDSDFDVNSQFDRINFFANSAPSSSSTTVTNSWTIGVAPTLMGFDNWYVYDRQIDSSFGPENAVNTGISLQQGVTYFFSVDVNPAEGTYKASISDGNQQFNSGDLSFRSPSINSNYLHFGGKTSASSDALSYSLDSVTISGGSPDAGPIYFPGFRGIWYSNQSLAGTEWAEYGYKYSGGFGTYPQQMRPQSYYSEESNKTFFTFGATNENNSDLYHVVSYYDHATGQVAKPRLLLSKGTTDAHDNPTMMMDPDGHIYIFSASHGTGRPSYINRSTEPYSIDSFEQVLALPGSSNFSYTQPLYVEDKGFMFLHTLYTSSGRTLKINTSSDGINWDHDWNNRPSIAQIPGGQYQVSEVNGQTVGTMFNWHPSGNVNARTNLYYMETPDFGETWQTVDGTPLTTPVTTVTNAAMVRNYQAEGKLVYLKDLQYDKQGNPILLYLTSEDWHPGPIGDPRTWTIAHRQNGQWNFKEIFTSDHNYDHGSLYIEDDGTWRIIAPTADGPQPWTTGGDMVMWTSHDEGDTWEANWQLTHDSQFNHTYARRPVNAHDDFYALWADGNTLGRSESRLYFTDRDGTGVWQLPWTMEDDFATPEKVSEPVLLSAPRTVGDFNEDGVVDAADYTLWRNAVGTADLAADATGDNQIDASDYLVWKRNYGRVLTPGAALEAAGVPEPAALVLLAAGLPLGLLVRRAIRRPLGGRSLPT